MIYKEFPPDKLLTNFVKNYWWFDNSTTHQLDFTILPDRFGISLKSYCNILRCYASFKHIKKGVLYPQQNYFDQSHFIKDLKKHTGNNPTELFENKNDQFLQLATMSEK